MEYLAIYCLIFGLGIVSALNDQNHCRKFSLWEDESNLTDILDTFLAETEKVSLSICREHEDDVPFSTGVDDQLKKMETILIDVKTKMTDINKEIVQMKTDLREMKNLKPEPRLLTECRCAVEKGMVDTDYGCFQFFPVPMAYEEAKIHCLAHDMNLASFEHLSTKSQLNHVENALGLKRGFWYVIGLQRRISDGNWEWVSGQKLSLNSDLWLKGEPQNREGENYAYLSAGHGLLDENNMGKASTICSLPCANKIH